MEGAKSIQSSLTLQGQLIQLVVVLSLLFGLEIGTEQITLAVQGVAALVGIAMVVYGRIRATKVLRLK